MAVRVTIALFGVVLRSSAAAAARVTIASLSNHDGDAWAGNSTCVASAANTTRCNLRVYDAAAAAAADLGADIVLYPEAYGLSRIDAPSFETLVSVVNETLETPCGAGGVAAAAPQQAALACIAHRHNLTVVASVFASLANGTRRIMQLAFDPRGTVLAVYAKYVLVPVIETRYAEPGPFAPTSIELLGLRWGLVICYEGVYPEMPWGDWKQLDALKAQGADALLWSIGSVVPEQASSGVLARKEGLAVAASEDKAASSFVDAGGRAIPQAMSPPLDVEGYKASARVAVAQIKPVRELGPGGLRTR